MTWLLHYVDPSDPSFVVAILTIAFGPFFWNVVSTPAPDTLRVNQAWGELLLSKRTDRWILCAALPSRIRHHPLPYLPTSLTCFMEEH